MITGENIQVHGGVGFTWDVDCHLLFRRVKANDVLFGRQAWQRQRLADLVIDPCSTPSERPRRSARILRSTCRSERVPFV